MFTKIVSLVGIRHATDSRNSAIRRLIWILWLLFGAGFAVYQIEDRLIYYLKYPYRTEVGIITDDKRLLMPQVTLCNEEMFVESKARNHKIHTPIDNIKASLKKIKNYEQEGKTKEREQELKNIQSELEVLHNLTQNWDNLLKNISQTFAETVIEATFNHVNISGNVEEVLTEMGYCFAFGTKRFPVFATKGGPSNGLYLKLNSESTSGYKVLIHDPDEKPRLKEAPAGFSIQTGTLSRVAVSFENVTFEGPPYYECFAEDLTYKVANCLGECNDVIFKDRCRCRDIFMSGNETLCSYAHIWDCTSLFRTTTVNKTHVTCDSCRAQCHSRIYKTSVTQISGVSSSNKVIQLYVYYPQIAFMEVKNVRAYPFLELLCEIGGALSLFLGATLLTVYEAMEFVILFIKDYLLYRFVK